MPKKRTALTDLVLDPQQGEGSQAKKTQRQAPAVVDPTPGKRPGKKQLTAYLPFPVYEQLRVLGFEERKKLHDYLMEGLDKVFAERGLQSIEELTRNP